jgi:hypothetical protein
MSSTTLSLDPFTPDRPMRLAQMMVALLHQILEERATIQAEAVRPQMTALEVESQKVLATVRFEAERLMYLAERAALDGFPVHDQLIELAAAHEVEIKRLGSQVIAEYKALSQKLQLTPRAKSVLKSGFDLAEAFQDGWLSIVRQMRHRAQGMARRPFSPQSVVAAAGAYMEAAQTAGGHAASDIALKPRVADDVVVYEMTLPVPAALAADPEALAAHLDRLHAAVEEAVAPVTGLLALRPVAEDMVPDDAR